MQFRAERCESHAISKEGKNPKKSDGSMPRMGSLRRQSRPQTGKFFRPRLGLIALSTLRSPV